MMGLLRIRREDGLWRGLIQHRIFLCTTYIPYHYVKNNSVTIPIRVVYDCSCQMSSNYPSLNDCLEVGPPLVNDLCSILLCFRVHEFGLRKPSYMSSFKKRTETSHDFFGFQIQKTQRVNFMFTVSRQCCLVQQALSLC